MFTPFMKEQYKLVNRCRGKDENKPTPTYTKLAGTCLNKHNYVVHFKTLKFYLERASAFSESIVKSDFAKQKFLKITFFSIQPNV